MKNTSRILNFVTVMGKQLSPPLTEILILTILAVLYFPTAGNGGTATIKTRITSRVTVQSTGHVSVLTEIGNEGDATAKNVTATLFLADDARRSDVLGDNTPGGLLHYKCAFDEPLRKPGNYTLVVRINFDDQSGNPHQVYHFAPVTVRPDQIKEGAATLSIALKHPYFNPKSFWQPGRNIKLNLINNLPSAIRAVVALYLPDGFVTEQAELAYPLAPGEKKEDKIPLKMEGSVSGNSPYHVVVWYESDGVYHSQQMEGIITVEAKPVYFTIFLIVGGLFLLIAILGVILYQFRRNKV